MGEHGSRPGRQLQVSAHQWPTTDAIDLPDNYEFEGQAKSTRDFLAQTDTAAVLVLRDGAICHESYGSTGGRM